MPAAIQLSAPTDGLLAPTDELPTPTDELPTPTDELPTPTEELPTPTEELPTPEAARVARRANLSEELEWYSAYDTDARSYNNEKFGMVILDAVKNFMPAALILMKAHGWHPMIAESARILRQSLAVLRELAPCLASNRAFMSHFDSLRQIALAYPTDEYERNKSGNRKPLYYSNFRPRLVLGYFFPAYLIGRVAHSLFEFVGHPDKGLINKLFNSIVVVETVLARMVSKDCTILGMAQLSMRGRCTHFYGFAPCETEEIASLCITALTSISFIGKQTHINAKYIQDLTDASQARTEDSVTPAQRDAWEKEFGDVFLSTFDEEAPKLLRLFSIDFNSSPLDLVTSVLEDDRHEVRIANVDGECETFFRSAVKQGYKHPFIWRQVPIRKRTDTCTTPYGLYCKLCDCVHWEKLFCVDECGLMYHKSMLTELYAAADANDEPICLFLTDTREYYMYAPSYDSPHHATMNCISFDGVRTLQDFITDSANPALATSQCIHIIIPVICREEKETAYTLATPYIDETRTAYDVVFHHDDLPAVPFFTCRTDSIGLTNMIAAYSPALIDIGRANIIVRTAM